MKPMLAVLPDRVLLDAAFSADGKFLALAFQEQPLTLWDLSTGNPAIEVQGANGPVKRVASSPDGKWLAAATDDRSKAINVWRMDEVSERE